MERIFAEAFEVVERFSRSHLYDLPENAYERLAETKEPSCPVCGSSKAQRVHRCEEGYCYWAEQADEAA
jgi:hypothetical protein